VRYGSTTDLESAENMKRGCAAAKVLSRRSVVSKERPLEK
jgi:hypothetical protein